MSRSRAREPRVTPRALIEHLRRLAPTLALPPMLAVADGPAPGVAAHVRMDPVRRSTEVSRTQSMPAETSTDESTDTADDDASGESSPDPELWRLVHAAQAGDGDAFGAIYDRYVETVYRYIYHRINGDRGLAEDLTSETFLRALRRFGTVTYQGRDLAAFFITIARNLVFDHTKSARFRFEVVTDDRVEPEPGQGAEATVLTALTNHQLMAAVRELPDEQQECIVLRFLHGLSVAETAQVMGKNDGAIKALQHRAVKRLHGLLATEDGQRP